MSTVRDHMCVVQLVPKRTLIAVEIPPITQHGPIMKATWREGDIKYSESVFDENRAREIEALFDAQ